MNLDFYLQQPFAQHALLAGAMIAVTCGLIGPFVVMRGMAFAVHGTSELAFTGAAAGLLIADNAVAGALVGAVVVAALLTALGGEQRDRDATIGVVLAFGLSNGQLALLLAIGAVVGAVMVVIRRPLLFASVDAEVAAARGVPVRALGALFLLILALTVTEAAQIVGTLLVLSLAISPAAAAQRLSASPAAVTWLSIGFALLATEGGILASLASDTVKPSVFITAFSFAIYLLARLAGTRRRVAYG